MAKLSDEQKIANKAARQVRDRLYRRRRKEYWAARDALDAALRASPEGRAREAASAALDVAREAVVTEEAAIRAQIVALQSELAAVRPMREPQLAALREVRDACNRDYNALASQQAAELEVRFADVAHCLGAGGWTPPPGYAEQAL